jgi:hypothetical protein
MLKPVTPMLATVYIMGGVILLDEPTPMHPDHPGGWPHSTRPRKPHSKAPPDPGGARPLTPEPAPLTPEQTPNARDEEGDLG